MALKLIGNGQHVAGRDHDDVGFEVLNQLHLAFGLSPAKRHNREAQFFCAIVSAQTASEQAIAIAHMHHVACLRAASSNAASHHRGPCVNVALGIAYHGGFASGATGSMDARTSSTLHCKHAVGIAVAQIDFGGERKLGQVCQGVAITRMHAGFIKLEFVNGRVIVGVLKRGFQTFELQGTQLVDAGFFYGF